MVKIEMHCHSAPASRCAKVPCEQAAQILCDHGYDALVLTNHYTYYDNQPHPCDELFDRILRDYETMRQCAGRLGLKVFFGAELRFYHASEDYLLYGLTAQELYDLGPCYQLDLASFYARKPAHALLVQAHPFRPPLKPADPRFLDGVEIHNGCMRHMNNNDKAFAFAKTNGLLMTSGSDFHQCYDGGLGGMAFESMPEDERALAQMLRDGKGVCLGGPRCADPYHPL